MIKLDFGKVITTEEAFFMESFFNLKGRNTSIRTEVTAGIATFMTMAYILAVQPALMKAAGMDVGAVTVSTALVSGIFSIFMGLYANLPFALAPAMGSNIVFAYTLVASGQATWQEGLGMTFISGCVFILLTILGLREVIVKAIPKNVKIAIGTAVGFFIVQIGLKNGGLMVIGDGSIGMASLKDPNVQLTCFGIIILIGLMARNIKGAILIGIIITTLIGIPMGITKVPKSLISFPPSIAPIAFKLDIRGAAQLKYFPIMFTFFVGDFFSTLGTLLGVSAKAGLLDEEGNLPGIERPFLVDAIGTVVGALTGLTVVTTYIESAAGVEEGGKTGLTAFTTGICFLIALLFTPLAIMIPQQATAPALIMIGLMMISGVKDIDFMDFTESFPAFATIVFTAYTSNLAIGISMGIISYVIVKLFAGKIKDLNWGTIILCIPLLYNLLTR